LYQQVTVIANRFQNDSENGGKGNYFK